MNSPTIHRDASLILLKKNQIYTLIITNKNKINYKNNKLYYLNNP